MSNSQSSSDTTLDGRLDFDSSEHQLASDVVPSDVETGGADHDIRNALGDDHDEKFKYDAKRQGERVAFRYESPLAALREYVANMETACIRTARLKLRDETDLTDDKIDAMSPWELLRTAEERVGYQGEIHIQHSDIEAPMPDLMLADNGIGISIKEYQIIEHVGLSANHDDGVVAGEMGQGFMSGFNFCGKHGFFRYITHSRLDDANYAMKTHIDRMKPISGERTEYGTTFEFPALTEEVHELDIREALEDICALVRVPVFYEEYDDNGDRVTSAAEEFLPQRLDDLVADNAPQVVYEDDFLMAVSAPELSNRRGPDPEGYMTCQPIERRGHKSSRKNGAPWKWHLWLKYENGPIWQCNCDDADHSGLVPISHPGYESLDEGKDMYVDTSTIDMDEHIQLPDPVDDKDRLNSGFADFYDAVGDKLAQTYKDEATRVYEHLAGNGLDGLNELPEKDRALLFKSFKDFGPGSKKPTGQLVSKKLKENLGVSVDELIAGRLAATRADADWARRSSSAYRVSKASGRDQDHKISDVLEAAGEDGTVYMAKTLTSADKVRLAWALHEDNQIVSVSSYGYYEDEFGWSKLKELDLYNIKEKYPNIDDDLAEELGKSRSSSGSSSSNSVGTSDQNPAERYVKVRKGTGMGKYNRTRGEIVKESLNGDEGSIKCAGMNYSSGHVRAERLLLFRQTEHSADAGEDLIDFGLAYAVVPNYVYDYLIDADRVYSDPVEMAKDMISETTVITIDMDGEIAKPAITGPNIDDNHRSVGTGTFDFGDTTVDQLTDDDLVVLVNPKEQARFLTMATGTHPDLPTELFRERLAELADIKSRFRTCNRLVFMTAPEINATWPAFSGEHGGHSRPEVYQEAFGDGPKIYRYSNGGIKASVDTLRLSTYQLTSFAELQLEYEYPPEEYDRSAPEWRKFGPDTVDDEAGVRFIEQLEAGAPDEGSIFPSQRGDN